MKVHGWAVVAVGASLAGGVAHASYWSISGATSGGVSTGGGQFDIYTELSHHFTANHGPGGNPMGSANLGDAEAAAVLGSLSLSLADNTLTYFGWVDASNRGYMGFAFRNTEATAFSAGVAGMNWLTGTQGLFSTHALDYAGYSSSSWLSVASNSTFLMVMGGYDSGASQITFNLQMANRNFGVEYLSFDESSGQYLVEASGTGTPSAGSGMSVATYTAEAMIAFGPITTSVVPGGGAMAIAVAASGLAGTLRRRRSAD